MLDEAGVDRVVRSLYHLRHFGDELRKVKKHHHRGPQGHIPGAAVSCKPPRQAARIDTTWRWQQPGCLQRRLPLFRILWPVIIVVGLIVVQGWWRRWWRPA